MEIFVPSLKLQLQRKRTATNAVAKVFISNRNILILFFIFPSFVFKNNSSLLYWRRRRRFEGELMQASCGTRSLVSQLTLFRCFQAPLYGIVKLVFFLLLHFFFSYFTHILFVSIELGRNLHKNAPHNPWWCNIGSHYVQTQFHFLLTVVHLLLLINISHDLLASFAVAKLRNIFKISISLTSSPVIHPLPLLTSN